MHEIGPIYLEVVVTSAAAANRILHMVLRAAWVGRVLVAVARASVAHSAPVQARAVTGGRPGHQGDPATGWWRLKWRAKSSAGVPVHAIAQGEGKAGSRQPAKAAPGQSGVCRSVPGMSPHDR